MSSTVRTPPPTCERHKAALCRALDDVEDHVAGFVGSCDVEKAEFVGACCVIGGGGLDGIARINEVDEVHALDDAAVLHIEAGDDAGFQHELFRTSIRRRL